MTTGVADALEGITGLHVEREAPLAPYTTYRIGGLAETIVQPPTPEHVARVLELVEGEGVPWVVLGFGSNVLVDDAGFRGVVVRVGRGLDAVDQGVDGDPHVWHVGAGLPTPRLARLTAAAGLAGVHRLVGVPGTVGGAVAMNAGAHRQEFGQVTESIDLVAPGGELTTKMGTELSWEYRNAGLGPGVVVGATIRLDDGDTTDLVRDIRRHFRWRKAGTPFSEPCCGSVFRNPLPDSVSEDGPRTAGQLIDAAGLKGYRIGDAEVSKMHANYIVNLGAAAAADVRRVIDHVRETIHRTFGIALVLEVKRIP